MVSPLVIFTGRFYHLAAPWYDSATVKRRPQTEDPQTLELPREGGSAPPPRIACLTVISHPDATRVGERAFLERGTPTPLSRTSPKFAQPGRGGPDERTLADPFLSRSPAHLSPIAGGGVRLAASEGSIEILIDGERVDGEMTFDAEALTRGVVLEIARVVLLLHERGAPVAALPRAGAAAAD